jgi:hypothetical protein
MGPWRDASAQRQGSAVAHPGRFLPGTRTFVVLERLSGETDPRSPGAVPRVEA